MIRRARGAKTQRAFAKELGMNQIALSRLELQKVVQLSDRMTVLLERHFGPLPQRGHPSRLPKLPDLPPPSTPEGPSGLVMVNSACPGQRMNFAHAAHLLWNLFETGNPELRGAICQLLRQVVDPNDTLYQEPPSDQAM